MTNDETLADLQVMLSHHERQIQELSDIVTVQAKDIDRLKKRLDLAHEKLAEVEMASSEGRKEGLSVTEQALRDKPPHY